MVLLLIFLDFIGRLEILGRSGRGSGYRVFRSLEVIFAIYHPLRLDLVDGSMGQLIPLKTTQISFLHVGT